MAMRRNALVGAGYVIAAVNDIGLAYAADEGRTTTTRIESFPNLPGHLRRGGEAHARLPPSSTPRASRRCGRDIDAAIAAAAQQGQCRDRGRGGLELGHRAVRAGLHRAAAHTARELGLPYREMRSQAGHDAYAVATMAPTAMIFTPCLEGISHNVKEEIELSPLGAGRKPAAERGGRAGQPLTRQRVGIVMTSKRLAMTALALAAILPAAASPAAAADGFDVVALGALGGIEDGNLSAWMIHPHGDSRAVDLRGRHAGERPARRRGQGRAGRHHGARRIQAQSHRLRADRPHQGLPDQPRPSRPCRRAGDRLAGRQQEADLRPAVGRRRPGRDLFQLAGLAQLHRSRKGAAAQEVHDRRAEARRGRAGA